MIGGCQRNFNCFENCSVPALQQAMWRNSHHECGVSKHYFISLCPLICWPLVECRTQYPKIWHFGIFQVQGIWEMTCAGRIFWSFPEAGHKTLMWEVTSLFLKERSILISKNKGTQRRPWKKRLGEFLQFTTITSYSDLSYCSMNAHSSSNLA